MLLYQGWPKPHSKSEKKADPNREERPWGSWTVLETGPNYKIKKIEVKSSCRLSLQMHFHRSEHWVVLSGTARVTKGTEELILRVGESTFVPLGTKHRLENPGAIPLVIIEIAQGEHITEDDIVRFEDDYNRHLPPKKRRDFSKLLRKVRPEDLREGIKKLQEENPFSEK